MRELTTEAMNLLFAGRGAFRPAATDRERVRQSLALAIGGDVLPAGQRQVDVASGLGATRLALRRWFLGGLGALAVGGGVLVVAHLGTKTSRAAAPMASSSAAAEPSVAASSPSLASSEEPALESQRVERASISPRPTRGASRSSADSLAEEVRLLSRAERQLSEGRADDALKTLGEHERQFPGGALAEERLAARVQSLCALGRMSEAKADLMRLARSYPRSPHVDRARRFCGLEVGATR
jgi:hypothetical protein